MRSAFEANLTASNNATDVTKVSRLLMSKFNLKLTIILLPETFDFSMITGKSMIWRLHNLHAQPNSQRPVKWDAWNREH
jgi:hypothetical protein